MVNVPGYVRGNKIIKKNDYAVICFNDRNKKEIAHSLISLEDVDKVKKHTWSFNKYNLYISSNKVGALSRYLMNAKEGKIVDHINRDTLDNRRENLRICNSKQNSQNGRRRKNNTSGVIGVTYNKKYNWWIARIRVNGKDINLGKSRDKEEATKLRLDAEKKYFGEYAPQNKKKLLKKITIEKKKVKTIYDFSLETIKENNQFSEDLFLPKIKTIYDY